MNMFHVAAAAGLIGLGGGIVVVNFVPTPRAAQIGMTMVGCGVVLLVLIAIKELLA